MNTESENNPYLSPSSALTEASEATDALVLRDPRVFGWLALLSISALCIGGIVQSFVRLEIGVSQWLQTAIIIAAISAFVNYLIWIYRCAANVQRLNRHSGVTPGWAVACHFVPIINWVAPCSTLRAIAKETFVARPARGLDILIIVWWIALLVRSFCLKWSDSIWIVLLWLVATMIAWISAGIIMLRIGSRQAHFRWSDLPVSKRPIMVSLDKARRDPLQTTTSGRPIPPRRVLIKPIAINSLAEPEARQTPQDH